MANKFKVGDEVIVIITGERERKWLNHKGKIELVSGTGILYRVSGVPHDMLEVQLAPLVPFLESLHPHLTEPEPDLVNHPTHYTKGGIETLDFIKAKMVQERYKGYLTGTVIKYLSRFEDKENPLQDLRKAEFYLKRLIKEYENV